MRSRHTNEGQSEADSPALASERSQRVASRAYLLTRSWYCPVEVSTLIHSPSLMKSGTLTTAPEVSVAGLVAPLAVSPLMPGSLEATCMMTFGGRSTAIALPL